MEFLLLAGMCPVPPKRDRRGASLCLISRKFASDSRLFSLQSEEISSPPCGFLIGIYLFCENWSTETFRKRDTKKWAVCYTSKGRMFTTITICSFSLQREEASEEMKPFPQRLPTSGITYLLEFDRRYEFLC